ncbi:MAG: amidohydrolase [Deltaproteobacteria bacterium]|jgi:predicted TIM-barrel fold metal-dependent hydrolase|nr:amidohydrolase [Deltaproteobacteria bacterium]
MDRYLVINSDGHAGLPPERYREYLDPQYRDEFDRQLQIRLAALAQASELLEMAAESASWAKDKQHGLEGAWDSDRRTEVIDADGVAAEILYVDGLTERNSPPFGGDLGLLPMGADPELQWAGCRSHNRWLTEFVSLDPVRRIGLALIPPFWDVDTSVKEIESARKQGLSGIMLPHLWGDQDPYHHPRFDPMWAACQDNDMIVHFHCGACPMQDYFGTELFGQQPGAEPPAHLPGGLGIFVTEVAFWLVRPIVFMIWGGVFERFPGLKAVVSEGTSIWAPELMALMDQRYSDHHFTAKLGSGYTAHIPLKPSEYFHRNVRIGSSCMPRREAEMAKEIGVQNIMWGTDYPHPEGTWPFTRKMMVETFHGMPEDDIAAMLGGNAAEFYGLDLDKLNPIVERIGPERSWFQDEAS